MEIVIAALVAAGVAVAVVLLVQRPRAVGAGVSAQPRGAERAGLTPVAVPGTHEGLLTHPEEIAKAILALG